MQLEAGTATFLEGKAAMIVGVVGADRGSQLANHAWALEVLDAADGRVRLVLDAADLSRGTCSMTSTWCCRTSSSRRRRATSPSTPSRASWSSIPTPTTSTECSCATSAPNAEGRVFDRLAVTSTRSPRSPGWRGVQVAQRRRVPRAWSSSTRLTDGSAHRAPPARGAEHRLRAVPDLDTVVGCAVRARRAVRVRALPAGAARGDRRAPLHAREPRLRRRGRRLRGAGRRGGGRHGRDAGSSRCGSATSPHDRLRTRGAARPRRTGRDPRAARSRCRARRRGRATSRCRRWCSARCSACWRSRARHDSRSVRTTRRVSRWWVRCSRA